MKEKERTKQMQKMTEVYESLTATTSNGKLVVTTRVNKRQVYIVSEELVTKFEEGKKYYSKSGQYYMGKCIKIFKNGKAVLDNGYGQGNYENTPEGLARISKEIVEGYSTTDLAFKFEMVFNTNEKLENLKKGEQVKGFFELSEWFLTCEMENYLQELFKGKNDLEKLVAIKETEYAEYADQLIEIYNKDLADAN